MPLLPRVRSLWNTLVHGEQLDRELDEELRAALETLAARYRREGLDDERARRAALAELGAPERVRADVREARIGAGFEMAVFDVRGAWRGIRTTPAFTAVVVLTLALGIGANAAIFSLVHAMLLQPLPYLDADRLAFIWLDRSTTNVTLTALGYPRGPMSGPDLRDLRQGTHTFSAFAGIWASGTIALTGEDVDPEQLRAALVTTNFFDVLGVEPALGRGFRPDDASEEPRVIVLGWDLFQRRYGGDPSLIGRRIDVNDAPVTVVGVMPAGFRLLLPTDAAVPDRLQAFAPFWPNLEGGPRQNLFLRVIGRMRPGVTLEQARADVAAMSRGLSRELGTARGFTTVALQDDGVKEIRGPLLALFGGVAILLLIACVNVASLLVARAASRARETAVRLALGASRGRLARQFVLEGLLLTLLGALAGVLAGNAALRGLLALRPESLSRLDSARVDGTVLAVSLGVSLVWGVFVSLAPLVELMKGGGPSAVWARLGSAGSRSAGAPVRYRTRAGLIVVQVALSVVLLVGAGLLTRAFVHVLSVDPAFETDRHVTFRMLIPHRHDFETFTAELHRRLAAIPGVTGVGTISHLPYDDLPNWGLPYSLERPFPPDAPTADARAVSPGLFDALGVRFVEGRDFTRDDRDPQHPVVIVDDMLARQLWPGRSAIGRQFHTRIGSEAVTVVGVVRHLKLRSLVDDLLPQIYVPWSLAQRNPTAYVLRTDGDPTALAGPARAVVSRLDPRLAIYDTRLLDDYVAGARSIRRFTVLVAAAFALTALILTCVGVYAVLAFVVASRRHEFGVRVALGAGGGHVVRTVVGEGLRFAAAGCAAGLVSALAAGRLLQSQLYGVHPRDPVTFGLAVGLMVWGALIACWIPARRATKVSPLEALRGE